MDSRSVRRDNTVALRQAAAQFNAKFGSQLFARCSNIANNSKQAAAYVQAYPSGMEPDNSDLAIREGDIMLALRADGGSPLIMANRTFEGTPSCFSSLNGFLIPVQSALKEGWPENMPDTPGNRGRYWDTFDRILRKQLMVVGVSMKQVPYPRPGGVHDDPVVQISGVTTMVNTGNSPLAVGDLVVARFPRETQQCKTNMQGQGISKSKRMMVTEKFDDPKYSKMAVTKRLKTSTIDDLLTNDLNYPLPVDPNFPNVPPKTMFKLEPVSGKTPLDDVCAKLFDLLDAAWHRWNIH